MLGQIKILVLHGVQPPFNSAEGHTAEVELSPARSKWGTLRGYYLIIVWHGSPASRNSKITGSIERHVYFSKVCQCKPAMQAHNNCIKRVLSKYIPLISPFWPLEYPLFLKGQCLGVVMWHHNKIYQMSQKCKPLFLPGTFPQPKYQRQLWLVYTIVTNAEGNWILHGVGGHFDSD